MPTHRSLPNDWLDGPPRDQAGRPLPLADGAKAHRLRHKPAATRHAAAPRQRIGLTDAMTGAEIWQCLTVVAALLGYLVGHAS